jgi:hypothetical protein
LPFCTQVSLPQHIWLLSSQQFIPHGLVPLVQHGVVWQLPSQQTPAQQGRPSMLGSGP